MCSHCPEKDVYFQNIKLSIEDKNRCWNRVWCTAFLNRFCISFFYTGEQLLQNLHKFEQAPKLQSQDQYPNISTLLIVGDYNFYRIV